MNMTGTPPRDDESDAKKTETLDASDLLDEDGKIDISKVKSRANMSHHAHAKITGAVCHDMRRMAARDDVTEAAPIAEAFDISRTTVRRHIKDRCTHESTGPVLEFRDARWQVVDSETDSETDDAADETGGDA